MLSNELKSKINKLWNKFYSRGITNPITAIEQISYLLFMRRLDDADALEKAKAIFSEQEYKSFFEMLMETDRTPLMFHCTAGKDRAGFAAALFLAALGVERETIIEDYMSM